MIVAIARPKGKHVAMALCAALLLGMVSSYVLLLMHGQAGVKQTDFMPYYSAGSLVLHGRGAGIYDLGALGRFERALVHPLHVRDGVMPYLYPPQVAMMLAPVAELPYGLAFVTWLVFNLALLATSLLGLARFAALRGSDRALFWVASLSFFPVLVALSQGQFSIVLFAALTGCFLALRSGHQTVAGVALSLVLAKPTYVVPVLIVLLIRRQWGALTAFTTAAGLLLLASLTMLGTAGARGYLATTLQAMRWQAQIGGFAPRWNQSFEGFAQLLLPAAAATTLTVALCLAALAAVIWRANGKGSLDAEFALAVVVGLLISPHVLLHDLSLLILPALIAVRQSEAASRTLVSILATGFAATVLGVPIVGPTRLQMTVPCMTALAIWLLACHLPVRSPWARPHAPAPRAKAATLCTIAEG